MSWTSSSFSTLVNWDILTPRLDPGNDIDFSLVVSQTRPMKVVSDFRAIRISATTLITNP